jgi:hypothetical protein
MKLLIGILLFSPLLSTAQAKSKIDSIVIEFLSKQPNTPKPILKITGNERKGTITRNYFWQANDPIIKDSVRIDTYLFGSGGSHCSTYLLTAITSHKNTEYHVIERKTIEEAIKDLIEVVEPFRLFDSQKALLINQLTIAYY